MSGETGVFAVMGVGFLSFNYNQNGVFKIMKIPITARIGTSIRIIDSEGKELSIGIPITPQRRIPLVVVAVSES
jgi:hypothetical protein